MYLLKKKIWFLSSKSEASWLGVRCPFLIAKLEQMEKINDVVKVVFERQNVENESK